MKTDAKFRLSAIPSLQAISCLYDISIKIVNSQSTVSPLGNLFQYIHRFDLSCHSKRPRRFPKLKIRTQLIFHITSTCFIFPLVSQEILEGDIMSAKMSHPAGKILWLIRVALWGDTVQRKCWKCVVVQKGTERLTLLPPYTRFEVLCSRMHDLVELLRLGGYLGHIAYRNVSPSAFQKEKGHHIKGKRVRRQVTKCGLRTANIKCSKWLVSFLESLMNSPFIAVIEAGHKPAFPFMKIFPGRRLQRTVAQRQLKRQASQISIKYYYILWLIKNIYQFLAMKYYVYHKDIKQHKYFVKDFALCSFQC